MRRQVPWFALAIGTGLAGWLVFDSLEATILLVGAVVAAVLAVGGPAVVGSWLGQQPRARALMDKARRRTHETEPPAASKTDGTTRNTTDDPPKKPKSSAPPTEVEEKAAEAYISSFLESPERHRSHAQAGYAIASAVAIGIIGAGVLADVRSLPLEIQLAAAAALLLWLLSAMEFMKAVAMQPRGPLPRLGPGVAPMLNVALDRVYAERDAIARAGGRARNLARAGTALTFATLVAAVAGATYADRLRTATLALTEQGRATLRAVCEEFDSEAGSDVRAELHPSTFEDETMEVTMEEHVCSEKRVTVRLRKSQISAIRTPARFDDGNPALPSPLSTPQVSTPSAPAAARPVVLVSMPRQVDRERRNFVLSVSAPREWVRVWMRFYSHPVIGGIRRFRVIRRIIPARGRVRIYLRMPRSGATLALTAEHGGRKTSFALLLHP